MKKTKIICSVGPACDNVDVMKELVLNGMNCARINLSHAKKEDILNTIEVVREVRKKTNMPVAIMYDTKGPEFRTLEFTNDGVFLHKNDTIKMFRDTIEGNEEGFSVNHQEAIAKIPLGAHVLIDNALLELEVIEKQDKYLIEKLDKYLLVRKGYDTYTIPEIGQRVCVKHDALKNREKHTRILGYELKLDKPYDTPIIPIHYY